MSSEVYFEAAITGEGGRRRAGTNAEETEMPVGEETDLFLMANLSPRLTGLPFVVWISPRGIARHDVRVKVSPGPRANPEEMISVAIRPSLRVIEAEMTAEHFELLSRWVVLNRDVLIRYWEGDLAYTEDVLASLRAI